MGKAPFSGRKMKSLEELVEEVSRLRAQGKRVVLANGCFDLIHAGHVRYLAAARNLGDCLVVAVNGDESTRLLKGEGRPIVGAQDRAEILSALECVDYCFIFDEPTLDSSIRALRPDVHAKGPDYSTETVPERSTVREVGGVVQIVGGDKSRSTKDLIGLILARFGRCA